MADEHGLRCSLALELAAKRLTTKALCEGAGVHPAAVTRLRRNQFAQLDAATFEKVCRFLGKEPGELLYLDPPLEGEES